MVSINEQQSKMPDGGCVNVETVGCDWATVGWNMVMFWASPSGQPDNRTNLVPAIWQGMLAHTGWQKVIGMGYITLAGGDVNQPDLPTALLVLGSERLPTCAEFSMLLLTVVAEAYNDWLRRHKASQPDAPTGDA